MPGDDIAALEARLRKIESEARDREALDQAKVAVDDAAEARRMALERVQGGLMATNATGAGQLVEAARGLRAEMDRIRRMALAYCTHGGPVNASTEALVAFAIGRAREGDELRETINTPQIADFLEAAKNEAIHQRERWGVEHDAGKRVEDWVALFQYLLGKLVTAHWANDRDKLLHHVITVAAVALNMHANLTGADTRMRPGIAPRLPDDVDPATRAKLEAAAPGVPLTYDELDALLAADGRGWLEYDGVRALFEALKARGLCAGETNPDHVSDLPPRKE